jgi:hypothetical protein
MIVYIVSYGIIQKWFLTLTVCTVTTIPGYSISRGMFIMFIGSRNGYPCT